MTAAEIYAAIGKRLLTMVGCPPVMFPNDTGVTTQPYLFVDFVPGAGSDVTLAGGALQADGYVMITAVTNIDENNAEGLRLAAKVLALFPYVIRLTEGTTTVLINRPPRELAAYRDGANWRTPSRVDYEAI